MFAYDRQIYDIGIIDTWKVQYFVLSEPDGKYAIEVHWDDGCFSVIWFEDYKIVTESYEKIKHALILGIRYVEVYPGGIVVLH